MPPAASVSQDDLDAMPDDEKWAWLHRLAKENESTGDT